MQYIHLSGQDIVDLNILLRKVLLTGPEFHLNTSNGSGYKISLGVFSGQSQTPL